MKFIIGNWKMNGTMDDKDKMCRALKKFHSSHKIILCLPFTLLNGKDCGIATGAQNISEHKNGAFTGDISGQMVYESGARYVIVGHSERRLYHNETNENVKQKAIAAIANNLVPVICVGETSEDKNAGRTMSVVKKMLTESIPQSGQFIVAYEPRWAIGTGKTPTDDEIIGVHQMIFKTLRTAGFPDVPIIYGGSININNANKIANLDHVDGLLVGGASLKSETFLPIIKSID